MDGLKTIFIHRWNNGNKRFLSDLFKVDPTNTKKTQTPESPNTQRCARPTWFGDLFAPSAKVIKFCPT